MRRGILVTAIVSLAFVLWAPLSAWAAPKPPTAPTYLQGTVTADIVGAPLSGITVRAYTYNSKTKSWTVNVTTTTNSSGFYRFSGAGTYRIEFVGNADFVGEFYHDQSAVASARSVVATSGMTATVDESLLPVQDGTAAHPYLVHDLASLDAVRANLGAQYRQVRDIDASPTRGWNGGAGWEPIGHRDYSPSVLAPFRGTFDGGGYTISGLYINRPGDLVEYTGLFGFADNATFRNVRLIDADVTGGFWGTGALVGQLGESAVGDDPAGAVEGCSMTGRVSGDAEVGGLVGVVFKEGARIVSSSADAAVAGRSHVGGLAGYLNQGTTVTGCSSQGTVAASQYDAGGLVGILDAGTSPSTMERSWSTCDVTTQGFGGGLAAQSQGDVKYCWATGSVTGAGGSNLGGLVGANTGTIEDCWASGDVAGGVNQVGGFVGANSPFGSIRRCFSTGLASGTIKWVGGFAGYNGEDTTLRGLVESCYFRSDIAGQVQNGWGTPATQAQLQDPATFVGWGFGTVWNAPVPSVSYPTLR